MKINLVIDGNYKLHSLVHYLHSQKILFGELENALNTAVKNLASKFYWDEIWFVSDSIDMNWRKKVYYEYKGTRKKSNEINWEFVFNTYAQFKTTLKENKRFKVVEVSGLEGDDLINLIVREKNSMNESCVVVSSDKDIIQLLDFREEPSWFNLLWRDIMMKEKIYVPKGFGLVFNKLNKVETDLFDFSIDKVGTFVQFYKELTYKTPVEEVEKEKSLFCKVIHGDTGDNIKSVLITKNGIGEAGADKIYNKYKENYDDDIDFNDSEWIENVIPIILEYKKVDNTFHNDVQKNIYRNLKMVQLEPKWIPNDLKLFANDIITKY